MDNTALRASAMLQEMAGQRNAFGDRAVNLAADNAELRHEVEALKRRVAELDKKPEAPQ